MNGGIKVVAVSDGGCCCTEPEIKEVAETRADDEIILFSRVTCPNCKVVAALLDKKGIAYTKLIADENLDLVSAYGVKQAPTLVVIKDGQFTNYKGIEEIKKYLA